MDFLAGFDMKYKKFFFWFIGLVMLFIIWKQATFESEREVGKLLDLYNKDNLEILRLMIVQNAHLDKINVSLPVIFAITPTYKRHVQKAELTRISQTLALMPNIQWIIVEDADEKSELVRNLLMDSNVFAIHLTAMTPPNEKIVDKNSRWRFHRGVEQRNKGLRWLRSNYKLNSQKGVVYFLDDDNTYSVKLFKEIAKVKKVGVWPVGLVGGLNAEAPIIDPKTGKVTGWNTGWRPDRPFAIDMAGFAINLDLILANPKAEFHHKMKNGQQESEFLSYFTTKEELEPLADNCTKVYVWHTRTENPEIRGEIPGLEV